jgi:hypothetical protein
LGDILLNPLSADRQCHTVDEVEAVVNGIVECLVYMHPAVRCGRCRFVYDDTIEARSVSHGGQGLKSDIARIRNKDLVRQWYLYTRNRAVKAALEHCVVEITDQKDGTVISGELRRELVVSDARWLSFFGRPIYSTSELNISLAGTDVTVSVQNSCGLGSFREWWPYYEASPKHRKDAYEFEGDWVSPMPLNDSEAQEALITSVVHGSDRYSLYLGVYYRFPRTHPNRNVYHGFRMDRKEVPVQVVMEIGGR